MNKKLYAIVELDAKNCIVRRYHYRGTLRGAKLTASRARRKETATLRIHKAKGNYFIAKKYVGYYLWE